MPWARPTRQVPCAQRPPGAAASAPVTASRVRTPLAAEEAAGPRGPCPRSPRAAHPAQLCTVNPQLGQVGSHDDTPTGTPGSTWPGLLTVRARELGRGTESSVTRPVGWHDQAHVPRSIRAQVFTPLDGLLRMSSSPISSTKPAMIARPMLHYYPELRQERRGPCHTQAVAGVCSIPAPVCASSQTAGPAYTAPLKIKGDPSPARHPLFQEAFPSHFQVGSLQGLASLLCQLCVCLPARQPSQGPASEKQAGPEAGGCAQAGSACRQARVLLSPRNPWGRWAD